MAEQPKKTALKTLEERIAALEVNAAAEFLPKEPTKAGDIIYGPASQHLRRVYVLKATLKKLHEDRQTEHTALQATIKAMLPSGDSAKSLATAIEIARGPEFQAYLRRVIELEDAAQAASAFHTLVDALYDAEVANAFPTIGDKPVSIAADWTVYHRPGKKPKSFAELLGFGNELGAMFK